VCLRVSAALLCAAAQLCELDARCARVRCSAVE
jgi:hypothetical protein